MPRSSRRAVRSLTQEELSWREVTREAHVSALIVGSLPILMLAMLWIVNRDYVGQLFHGAGRFDPFSLPVAELPRFITEPAARPSVNAGLMGSLAFAP